MSYGDFPNKTDMPDPHDLWVQAGEDGEKYRELMIKHGLMTPVKEGDAPRVAGAVAINGVVVGLKQPGLVTPEDVEAVAQVVESIRRSTGT